MPAIALFIGFLICKLIGYLQISWWWVTCPLWAAPFLLLCIMLGSIAWALIVVLAAQTSVWLMAGLVDIVEISSIALGEITEKKKKK